ncbi:oxidoreductase [Parasediminibacterium paludis]|uniref:Oxidoreductase n=1 Tax=Parasediminibacterium paludis TaxID=908966 RepID=A0ABV8PXG6_9BACT
MQKVALVTGASSGIGKETAKLLVQAGYTVYGAARRVDKMQDLQAIGVKLLAMDVTDDASVESGVAILLAAGNRIDLLVNNAGYGSFGALEDVPLSEARYQFEVNIFGLARLTQLLLPTMRAQRSGTIVNISSIGGKLGEPHGAWYHATKHAVEGLSDSLRMELKQFSINVVIIEPGAIITEWDGITSEHLLKVSGNTAYGVLAKKHVAMFTKTYKFGSQPIVVAKTIVKAAMAKNPRTRYATGGGAKFILFFRYLLPDKWFDAIMLANIR